MRVRKGVLTTRLASWELCVSGERNGPASGDQSVATILQATKGSKLDYPATHQNDHHTANQDLQEGRALPSHDSCYVKRTENYQGDELGPAMTPVTCKERKYQGDERSGPWHASMHSGPSFIVIRVGS